MFKITKEWQELQIYQVPIQELLRAVPRKHCLDLEIERCHHRHIPVGVHCHDAADRITSLESQLAEQSSKLKITIQALFDIKYYTLLEGKTPSKIAKEALEKIGELK